MGQSPYIDRNSFEPAYSQLANILRGQMAEGVFLPGSRLPSESQLCQKYKVSPMTVRRSINLLADQGTVSTSQGRGTFVKPLDLGEFTFQLQEFQNLFKDKNSTKANLLEVRIVSADPVIASHIDINTGDRAIYMRRLITKEGSPALYHQEYLMYDPTLPIVEDEMEVTSLHGLFTGTSETNIKKGKLTFKATALKKEEARLLESRMNTPAFNLEHIFYNFDNKPISWGWFIIRGDLLSFTTTVGIWDE